MLSKIKRIKENILFKNTSYLFIFQLFNALVPLLILPYIIPILSVEKYGTIIFIQTFAVYFIMLTEYGFNISATKDIAQNKDSIQKLAKIYSRVMISRVFLALIGLLIYIFIILSFKKVFNHDFIIYLYAYLLVIAMALIPNWFFNGMENMKLMVILNFVSKIIFIILIFMYIESPEDFGGYILINSVSHLILAFTMIFIIKSKYAIGVKFINFNEILMELKNSYHYFTSKISSALYLNNNIFILGVFAPELIVGYYAIAEKIVRASITIMNPLNQATLPYLSRIYKNDVRDGLKASKKIFKIILTILVIFTIFLILSSEYIAIYLVGIQYYNKIIFELILIMSLIPIFGIIGYYLSYNVLANIGLIKEVPKIMVLVAIINLVLNLLLIPQYNAYGSAISILLTEMLLTILLFNTYIRKGKKCIV